MSIGGLRGTAVTGQPLDVLIPIALEQQDDVSSLCVESSVFYGDSRLASSRVRVNVAVASASREATARVRASAVIDEPVVTVVLRAGCQQKVERRYVVLADITAAAAASSAPASEGAQTTAVLRGDQILQREAAVPPRPVATRSQSGDGAFSRRRGSDLQTPSAASSKTSSVRLKLEPFDLLAEPDPVLKASAQLLSSPTANPQERAAAAALWLAITAQPQDLVRELEKVSTLQTSLNQLQTEVRKNKAVGELQGKLEQSRSERYANDLVYAPAGLLVPIAVCLAYALWHWRQAIGNKSSEIAWWRKNDAEPKGWHSDDPVVASEIEPSGSGSTVRDLHPRPAAVSEAVEAAQGNPRSIPLSGSRRRANAEQTAPLLKRDRPEFAPSSDFPSRAVKAEELFDVQQKADFFISIGQYEQAIEFLGNHISDHGETSALIYLDLFNLYHQTGRRADYDELRPVFNSRFNADLPIFDLYNAKDLEAHQAALTPIESLRPTPKVLQVIEESIVRHPDAGAKAFDIEAYREAALRTALVVEDDSSIRFIVNFILKQHGWRVLEARDGLEGREAIAHGECVDFVVLDVMLPEVDGLELLSQLKAEPRWSKVPVMMLTGKVDEASVSRALSAGAADYMIKPFDPSEFSQRVESLMRAQKN